MTAVRPLWPRPMSSARAVFERAFGRRHPDFVRAVVVSADVSADLRQWQMAQALVDEGLMLLGELGPSPANDRLRARALATGERIRNAASDGAAASVQSSLERAAGEPDAVID